MLRFALKPKLAFFLLVLFGLFHLQCKKDEDTIPSVQVNFYLQTTDPEFNSLNAVGGWVYVNGGSRGIVIYRLSMDEFMAYDRHCPYTPSESCAQIDVESSGISALDDCCGSQFLLTDGTVVGGPSTEPLKRYQTYFDGNQLRVYN